METSFGRYELIEKIGTGGMAEIYRAKSVGAEGLEKDLVIKRILPEYAENQRFIEMFITEADIAVGLNHPNIVQIYDFGKVDDDYFLAMEYVDGPNLHRLLQATRSSETTMEIGDAIYVAIEVAKGLHYAHRRSDEYGEPLEIVHRDISPQNILVSRDGAVKIVDFGIAKATSAAEGGSDEVVKGKFRYMSPEQARGGEIDARSDLFSLGVVLFEMVCGQPLFDQETRSETLSLVKSAVVPDIASLNDEIPGKLERLLYKLLERDPTDRYQDARDLQVELTQVLYDLGEIHDAMTLATHLREIDAHLGDNAESSTSAPATSTPSGTSALSTTGGVTGETTADVQSPDETVATPADSGFDSDDTDGSDGPAARLQARERKEAVFIDGRVDGLLALKGEIDENRTWIQVLDEYTRIVDSITFKNDGRVHHVDESGFLIALGIPVSSQNDAVRGLQVAMDLREAVRGMNLSLPAPIRLAIGVAIGDVAVEQQEVDGRPRYDWSFYGDSHEDAGKLARAAMAGEILVSQPVQRRIRRDFDCEPLDAEDSTASEIVIQGEAFRMIGPKSPEDRIQEVRRSYHSFYGRELALRTLRERFRETVLEEQAGGVVVQGEQGVGKSTLVEEFLEGLARREVRLLRASVTPFDRDVPMGSLANLFIELMRLGDRSELRRLRGRLETRVDALFPDASEQERELLLHSLSELFNLGYPGGRFSELDSEEKRGRIFLSLERVLERFAEHKPVVLAVDDAHHIDSVSLQFARQFFAESRSVPAFFVFTADSSGRHAGEQAWEAFLEAKYLDVETLDELNESEARSLIGDLVRAQGVRSEQLVDEVYRLSGGNPLYIKEVIAVLRDQGKLKSPEEWEPSGEAGGPPAWLPASVEEFLAAKIDRLDLPLKVLLKRVSLLWTPFSVEDAELVADEDGAEADDQGGSADGETTDPVDGLEALVRQRILERADEPEGVQAETFEPETVPREDRRYRFANALTREVASRLLMPDEAQALHATIAEYLVGQSDEPGVSDRARMARHFEGAGRVEEAIEHYLEAADAALEHTGAAESLRLANKALELLEDEPRQAFRAHGIRQRSLAMLGEAERTREALERLEALAEQVGTAAERGDVLLRFAKFHVDRGEFDEGRRYTERARQAVESTDDAFVRAESWYHDAGMLMTEGDREGALELTERAIEHYRDGEGREARRGLARCQNMKGIVLRRAGRHEAALEVYDDALEHARAVDDGKLTRFILNNSGLALVYLGHYSEALNRYRRALEQCRRLGHRFDQAEYWINIGHAQYLLGRTDEAVSTIRRGIYRARQTGVNSDIANGLISLGLCYLEQGKLEAADRSLHEGLRIADSIPEAYFGIHAMFALARVRLNVGTPQDAKTALLQAEDGLERSREAQMDWGPPYGKMLMARALHHLGRRDEAVEASREAVAMLEDLTAYGEPEILYYHSQILPDDAEHGAERREAIERARQLVLEREQHVDEEHRASYLERPINQQILNTAKVMES